MFAFLDVLAVPEGIEVGIRSEDEVLTLDERVQRG
jgi:hypothetical protein